MTKEVEVDKLDDETRRQLEAFAGQKLEAGDRVTIQVWPPGVEPDIAHRAERRTRARLKTRPAGIKGSLSRRDIYDGVV